MARELSPHRADALRSAITGAERVAEELSEDLQEASRENPLDGNLEDALETVKTAARLLQQAQEAVLGVFLADPPARDQDPPLAEWTHQELLHAEDPARELSVEVWRRMTDSAFQRYAAAEVRKAVPAGRRWGQLLD